ncbi:MAG: dihydrofolate reductase [Clostridia bacterium]|nr:dihydrofolate reductase [Clostridia bacterium]
MDLIVAADKNCAIGKNGDLLYSIPDDMKYFRRMTAGKVVVMGKKTLLSFPGQKPLKNRTNIVLTSDHNFAPEGVIAVHSFDELFAEIAKYPSDQVMLIGGGSLYSNLYPFCERAYVTWVDASTEGADTFIPDFRTLPGWFLYGVTQQQTSGDYRISFATYTNKKIRSY